MRAMQQRLVQQQGREQWRHRQYLATDHCTHTNTIWSTCAGFRASFEESDSRESLQMAIELAGSDQHAYEFEFCMFGEGGLLLINPQAAPCEANRQDGFCETIVMM